MANADSEMFTVQKVQLVYETSLIYALVQLQGSFCRT